MSRTLQLAKLMLATVGMVVLFAAAPAEASVSKAGTPASDAGIFDIYTCYVFPADSSATAYCSGTAPSQFRAFVTCNGGHLRYGPWRTAGGSTTSTARCPVNTFVIQDGVETK